MTAQAHEYEQLIRDLNAAMQAEKTTYEQRIREPEETLKWTQQWRFGRKSEHLPLQRQLKIYVREGAQLADRTSLQIPDSRKGDLWAYVSATRTCSRMPVKRGAWRCTE